METEIQVYIPLETNDDFFDGFYGDLDALSNQMFMGLAVPSELYKPNRNGNIYPREAFERSLVSVLLTQPLLLHHEDRMALPNFAELLEGDWPEYEDIEEEEELFTKVNWKEEGF